MGELLRRLWHAFRHQQRERELAEEIALHREMKARDLAEDGVSPAEAAWAARRAMGSLALAQDQVRDVWTPRWLQGIGQDVRGAGRSLRTNRWTSLVAIVSLALAIGATTAMFSVLRALLFRPLPIRDPYSLVQIATDPRPAVPSKLSFPAFRALDRAQHALTPLIGFTGIAGLTAEAPDGLTSAATMGVTANFYDTFDVHPAAGRLFHAGEFTTDVDPIAVLGYSFWVRAFGRDTRVIGQTIRVDDVPLTVIGVAPQTFRNLNVAIEPAITVPLPSYPRLIMQRGTMKPWTEDPIVTWVSTAGRLRSGVTLDQARAQIAAVWPAVRESVAADIADPGRRQASLKTPIFVRSAATGFEEYRLRSRFTAPSYAALGIALLVLTLACVNVANLLLSRAAAREHETAVRVALGASRGRLVRQLLCEGLLLSLLAAGAGVLLALWASQAFPQIVFANALVPFGFDVSVDGPVVAFACAVAVATGILFSLAPIWRATRHDPAASLQSQRRTVVRTGRLGQLLVGAQVALCLVLMAVAGILVRSLQELRTVDVGFNPHGIVVAYPGPRPGAYVSPDNDAYYPALLERVRALPGVRAVGISQDKPFGGQPLLTNVSVSGVDDRVTAPFTSISPGYLEAMGINLLSGRDLTWADNSQSRPVVLISQSLARRLFGTNDATGREVQMGAYADERSDRQLVVGVIADARAYDIKDPTLYMVYSPSLQRNAGANGKALVIRGAVSAHDVSQAIEPLGKESVTSATTLDGILDQTLLQERLTGAVAGFFGMVALLLSAIGLYGLMRYAVVQRRREIGVRIALGGQSWRVTWQILQSGLFVTTAGLVVGLGAAWVTTRLVNALLFKVTPHDLATMLGAPLLLLVVAIVACGLPAWRAARVDPVLVLRSE